MAATRQQQKQLYEDQKQLDEAITKIKETAATENDIAELQKLLDSLETNYYSFCQNHVKIMQIGADQSSYFTEKIKQSVDLTYEEVSELIREKCSSARNDDENKKESPAEVLIKQMQAKNTQSSAALTNNTANQQVKVNGNVLAFKETIYDIHMLIANGEKIEDNNKLDKVIKNLENLWEEAEKTKYILMQHNLLDDDILDLRRETKSKYEATLDEWSLLLKKAPEQQASVKLADIKIPIFFGNVEEWTSFHDLFKKLVHDNKQLSGVEKMYYLKTQIKNDALKLIQHLPVTEDNYESAWEMLVQRFGNRRILFASLIDRIIDLQPINTESLFSVKKALETTTEAIQALKAMQIKIEDSDPILARIIIRKLDKEGLMSYEQTTRKSKQIQKLNDVLDYLEQQYQVLEAATNQKQTSFRKPTNPKHQNPPNKSTTFMATSSFCQYCKRSGHETDVCRGLLNLSIKERNNWVWKEKICTKCLKHKYNLKCANPTSCNTCGKSHNTILHFSQQATTGMTKSASNVLLATAQVRVKTVNGDFVTMRALIDQGSQATIITEEAAQLIRLPKEKAHMELHGIGNMMLGVAKSKMSIEIHPRVLSENKFQAEALILPSIAAIHPQTSFKYEKEKWKNVTLADPEFNKADRIDMLIGGDLYIQILDEGMKKKNGILGQNTYLGYILSGVIQVDAKKNKNFVNVTSKLEKFFEIEEIHQDVNPHEDEVCMEKYSTTTTRNVDGRFSVSLPFKDDKELGKSYKRALARFLNLEKRFQKDEKLKFEYSKFMAEYLMLGHMKEVATPKQGIYYIPHQAVIRENSLTTKIRVVFDASATTTNGKSLNDIMYVGPRLQKDVFDILINFRLKKFVITADVEKMYRQILVNEEDQKYQHILWRDNQKSPIKEFQLRTVTYGTASAPFLAVRTLFEVAKECSEKEIANIIREDFYMDDLLTGADTTAECNNIKRKLSQHMEKYGLHLRKWCSNSKEIIKSTPSSKEHEIINIEKDECIKTLGLQWIPQGDEFKFEICRNNATKITKRLALSYLASIFDPLGLLTPITVAAKLFIQQLWLLKMDWDTELEDQLKKEWNSIVQNIHVVGRIRIPRWVHVTSDSSPTVLLGFADASEKAYAAVVYVKCGSSVSLMAAKSKVNPIKNRKTLPKLELLAAQLLSKLLNKIETITKKSVKIYAWSDSTITLAWIANNKSKDKFIRTRVSDIKTLIPSAKWHHVKSKENPADVASRGISPEKMEKEELWWRGPEWLQQEGEQWTGGKQKNVVLAVKTIATNKIVLNLIQNISSFRKLRRVVAYILRFINKLRGKKDFLEYLSSEELWEAEKMIIKTHQYEELTEEISALKTKGYVDHRSKIATLNPQLDEDGLIRVGGRLQLAKISFNKKHPIVLNKSTFSESLIRYIHQESFHGGNRLVENIIRNKYWIIGLKNSIKKCIRGCVKCIRFKKEFKNQLMGILPEHRVNVSPPFTHCGIDYAGPLQLKFSNGRGQKSYKGYIAVFVCMATKAVHLEVVSSLTTEAFLAALRRFFARRGKSSHIYSDNGTNFVGAKKQLDKDFLLAIRNNKNIAPILEEDKIKWHFIPPASPNFGGIWEAAVKSMKHHLKRVIGENKLTYEELSTLTAQIEAVLNSRPLHEMGSDPGIRVLTPGHFLIGRTLLESPEENEDKGTTCLSRWRLVQKIKLDFWKQWKAEYLNSLQQRYRWKYENHNLQKGQVVIIKNEETHPTRWPLGRVIEVHPGIDGLVRVVSLKTENGILKRPVSKLSPLEHFKEESKEPTQRKKVNIIRKIIPKNKQQFSMYNILLILMLLLCGTKTQQVNNSGGSIVELKNNTVLYLDQIGSVNVVSSSWNMIVYFDMEAFFNVISNSEQMLEKMETTCGKLQAFEDQCHHILNTMKRQVENMKNTNIYLFPQSPKRSKRAPFEFMGSLQHIFFGTMDADDRREVESNMQNLLDNQQDLKFLIKKQTSVVESTINILRRTTDEVGESFRSIRLRVNNITETMKETYYVYRESIKFFMVTKELQIIIEENERVQTQIIGLLIDINHGKLNPALVTPVQLQAELDKIREHIPEHLKLPGKKYDQLRSIYKLMTALATILENKLVISVSIPLFNDHISQLHKLIPMPILKNSKKMAPVIREKYMIYNFNMDSYHMISQAELNNCQKFSEEEFVCESGWPWIHADDNSCEVSPLKPLNRYECSYEEVKENLIWKKLHYNNQWVFKNFNRSSAHIQCQPNKQYILELPQQGILSLSSGCSLRIRGATVLAHHVLKSESTKQEPFLLTTGIQEPADEEIQPLKPSLKNHSEELNKIKNELSLLKDEKINLRGLHFHHMSGHVSLFLVLFIILILIFLYVRFVRKKKPDVVVTFAPRNNV